MTTHPRVARILQKMTPGTMGGESRVASQPGFSRLSRAVSQPSSSEESGPCAAGVLLWDGTQSVVATGDSGDASGTGPSLQPILDDNGLDLTVESVSGNSAPLYFLSGLSGPLIIEVDDPGDINPSWSLWFAYVSLTPDWSTVFFSASGGEPGIIDVAPGTNIMFGVFGDGAGDPDVFSLVFSICPTSAPPG